MKIRLMGSIEEIESVKKALQDTLSVSWRSPYKCRGSEDIRVYGEVLGVSGENDAVIESRERGTEA